MGDLGLRDRINEFFFPDDTTALALDKMGVFTHERRFIDGHVSVCVSDTLPVGPWAFCFHYALKLIRGNVGVPPD